MADGDAPGWGERAGGVLLLLLGLGLIFIGTDILFHLTGKAGDGDSEP